MINKNPSFANSPAKTTQLGSYKDATPYRLLKEIDDIRFALDQSSIVAITDAFGVITYVNDKFVEVSGYSRDELVGKTHRVINSAYHSKDFIANLWNTIKAGKVWQGEIRNKAKDGHYYWVDTTIVPFVDEDGIPYQFVSIRNDVTDHKLAEENIKNSLEEKKVLLKEIHHRVKNNLQIITSLLNLQSKYIKDNQTLDMFKEAQNRIKSMAMIHEKLYQSNNLDKVDFRDYIQNLTAHLFRSYGVNTDRVSLELHLVENLKLNIDVAISCGLIINELVSNAIKYGFPENGSGKIEVQMSKSKGVYSLIVRDTGVGLPKNLTMKNLTSLGLSLVDSLVKQLSGTMEIKNDIGTSFEITFQP